MMLINISVNIQKKIKLKTSTKPEQNNLFNGLTLVTNMIGYTLMTNTNKGQNTMTILTNNFYTTMNNVDSQLHEVAKILKSFNSTLNVEDLMINVYENIERNIFTQLKDENFKKLQKNKDNTIVS